VIAVRLRWWLADRLRPNVWPSTAAQHGVLLGQIKDLTAVADFAEHASWRCAWPPHYYLADGPPRDDENYCPCGLLDALEKAGIDPEPWR
jgi:hypothetical protein